MSHSRRPQWALPVSLIVLTAACDLVVAEDEGCYAGEFPARCAVVEGVVTDSAGVRLSGITTGPRFIADDCCATTYTSTDASGRYSLRIIRPVLRFDPSEDTLTLFVGAARAGEGWIDSVMTFIDFTDPEFVHEVNLIVPVGGSP